MPSVALMMMKSKEMANRVNGASCPICLQEQKSSLPEQAIFYYANKQYNE
jgi:hypothetical protein